MTTMIRKFNIKYTFQKFQDSFQFPKMVIDPFDMCALFSELQTQLHILIEPQPQSDILPGCPVYLGKTVQVEDKNEQNSVIWN